MDGDVVWNLQAIPLTPIHVGDGTVLDPFDFVLRQPETIPDWMYDELDDDDPRLQASAKPARLVPHAWRSTLRNMSPLNRRKLVQALDGGDLRRALDIFRRDAKPDDSHAIALCDASYRYLRSEFDDPNRACRVGRHVRDGAAPILPGSSLKGMLRTALLDRRAADRPGRGQDGLPKRATELEDWLLGRRSGAMETDPFRWLAVGDAAFPSSCTRVEKVCSAKLSKGRCVLGDTGELHLETLSPGPSVMAHTSLRVAGHRREHSLTAEEIWDAAEAFGLANWEHEMQRFWQAADHDLEPTAGALERLRKKALARHPGGVLVRIGGRTHFESKSIARVRRNQNHKTKEWRSEGATRAVVRVDDAWLPLGWLLVMRVKASA